MTTAREALSRAAQDKVKGFPVHDQTTWDELWEDAASDFQAACLEAALVAGHPLTMLHAFGDAIRGMDDGRLAQACRPAPGEPNQDPLRAFERNGFKLSPRKARPPPPPLPVPIKPLLDLSGGLDPVRYKNLLDTGDPRLMMGGLGPPPTHFDLGGQGSWLEDLLNEAGQEWTLQFEERAVDPEALGELLEELVEALETGIPVPVLLADRKGAPRRAGLLLQVSGSRGRRAFQLHDPLGNQTLWVNGKDLAAGKDLPLDDKTLKRIAVVCVPRIR